jgi:hypothetical protein
MLPAGNALPNWQGRREVPEESSLTWPTAGPKGGDFLLFGNNWLWAEKQVL